MYTVTITGLEVYAHHGVPDAEQEVGHRYVFDLELEIDGDADKTDRIDDTVDYAAVAKDVEALNRLKRFRTLERLATEIAEGVLANHGKVVSVEVVAAKPMPPAPIIAAEVSCRVRLERQAKDPDR